VPRRSYIDGVRLFGLLLLVAGSLHAQANRANVTEGFDKPLREIVVDPGAAPFHESSQHVRNKLTCFYYSAMAKALLSFLAWGHVRLSPIKASPIKAVTDQGRHRSRP
jgi:hypothetical protein